MNPIRALAIAFLFATAAVSGAMDDADRIISAIGVDSIVSEDEEAYTRSMLAKALSETSDPAVAEQGPQFDELVRRVMEANQQSRRNPLVAKAYRDTLIRMLTPEELKEAADFYSSPTGRKAHIAAIEAEKAAVAAMEQVTVKQP
jgi:hypothetical protein